VFVQLTKNVQSYCRLGSSVWSRYTKAGSIIKLCNNKKRSGAIVWFWFGGTKFFADKKDMAGAYRRVSGRRAMRVRL